MSYGNTSSSTTSNTAQQYKGVRRRKWGKWVSEIRVPGSQARLWLGSYATPEAAAVAHDVAFYCLRRPPTLDGLNFPHTLPLAALQHDMSPRSVQRAASDAGLAVDAHRAQLSAASAASWAPGSMGDGNRNGAVCGSGKELVDAAWGSDGEAGTLSISVEDYF